MTRLLPFLFLLGIAAELTSIIVVGDALGVVATLLLLLAGGVFGIGLMRSAGTSITAALRSPVQSSSQQRGAAGTAMARASAGLLFLVPGFFSDILALLLLFPPVRRWLRSKLPVQGFTAAGTTGRQAETIIEAEAIEIVGELDPPDPPPRRDRPGTGEG